MYQIDGSRLGIQPDDDATRNRVGIVVCKGRELKS
jgi:hypothetical protein